MRLMDDPGFPAKKVLLVDSDPKNLNDRTWCFWEKEDGYFEDIVYQSWKNLFFKDKKQNLRLNIKDYRYKMIRGIDFYSYCLNRIKKHPNIEWLQQKAEKTDYVKNMLTIHFHDHSLTVQASCVFSSIPHTGQKTKKDYSLIQHFKGWIIETEDPSFHPEDAVLMDFSVDQHEAPAAFIYQLPLSSTKALIEYTVFSEKVFEQEVYDLELKKYFSATLPTRNYYIEHVEYGTIPMTNQKYHHYRDGIYYLGTAGGQTKPSTGYTFQFIQKQSAAIANALQIGNMHPAILKKSARFGYYDSILLGVLSKKEMQGAEIFKRLFTKVPAWLIFRFLDNETRLSEEITILNSMPPAVFMPAALRELVGKLFFR